jgi:hypothetical protein
MKINWNNYTNTPYLNLGPVDAWLLRYQSIDGCHFIWNTVSGSLGCPTWLGITLTTKYLFPCTASQGEKSENDNRYLGKYGVGRRYMPKGREIGV